MGYKVRYLVNARETGHELVSDLKTAKTIVENYAATGANHAAEAVDASGAVVYRRPRTLRPSA